MYKPILIILDFGFGILDLLVNPKSAIKNLKIK